MIQDNELDGVLDGILKGHGLTKKEFKSLKIDIKEMENEEAKIVEKLFVCINEGKRKGEHPFSKMLVVLFAMAKVMAFISLKCGFPIDMAVNLIQEEYKVLKEG